MSAPRIWWSVTIAALLLLVAVPLFAGMVAACDDISLLLIHYGPRHGLLATIDEAWHAQLFRPLAGVSGMLVDPLSRTGPWVVGAQSAALCLGLAALRRVAGHVVVPAVPWPLAAALWLVHPATSVSLWQMDTLSQTASAAAGLWLVALASRGWNPRHETLAWVCVTCLGLLTKETFLGWVPVAAVVELRSRWPMRRPSAGCMLALALAGTFVLVRLSIVAGYAATNDADNYSLRVGISTLKNTATLMLGGLAFGPLHAARVLGPVDVSWWLVVAGVLAHIALLVRAAADPRVRVDLAYLWSLALIALGPVLFMGHVSELYLMGPNALLCIGLASAVAVVSAGRARFVFRAGTTALVACACAGLVSRAYHFRMTWLYSRVLAQEALALPARVNPAGASACAESLPSHSVYVVSPAAAMNPAATAALAEARGAPLPADWVQHLDCARLPRRARW